MDDKLLEKYNIEIDNEYFCNDARIIESKTGRYVVKKKKIYNKKDVYSYLESRNFNFFTKPINEIDRDSYELYEYINSIDVPDELKAEDIIVLTSILHAQTSYFKKIELDEIKKTYEKYIDQLKYLDDYYHNLQDLIETRIYMSPSEYLLIRNISQFYAAIEFSKNHLEKWYAKIVKKTKERVVQLHNNLDLSHYVVGDSKVLLSWDKSSKGNPINDLIIFYKKYFLDFDFTALLNIYQSKYSLLEEEINLLFCILSMPDKIDLGSKEYLKCREIHYYLLYMKETSHFILENEPKPSEE